MKFLYFIKDDGSKWKVPLKVIAEYRAIHYVNISDKPDEFEDEVKFVLEDDFEGEDWASNNMDFEDIEEHAVLVEPAKKSDFDWANCEKGIGEENE